MSVTCECVKVAEAPDGLQIGVRYWATPAADTFLSNTPSHPLSRLDKPNETGTLKHKVALAIMFFDYFDDAPEIAAVAGINDDGEVTSFAARIHDFLQSPQYPVSPGMQGVEA